MAAIGSAGVDSPAMATYVLVSCGKEKLSHAAPAKDLYTSTLFKKARAWAERSGHPWFILSGKHDVVHPDTVLEPYDANVSEFLEDPLSRWSSRVARQLIKFTKKGDKLIVLAGGKYMDFVRFLRMAAFPSLRDRAGDPNADVEIIEPMKGLQIGQRLAWLTQQLQAPAPAPAAKRLCPISWRK